MTRRLVLVRHAKAEQGGASDLSRPLASRGRADAAAIGRWLATQGVVPDRVVVSPSTRTRQTAAAALPEFEPDVDDRVYDNTVDDLLAIARETPPATATLVLVGHNPSVQAFAMSLDDGRGDASVRRALADGYPTSGVAVFDVDAEWPLVESGTLHAFAVPRG